ncbi:unnamed protein product [Leptidea sinapis]|uniref:EamA domain-containing protein n=1 Tax=Leptidea sinapis TaxID=189913 RepID=A0A5E4R6Z8_9NEOP|nr:unnamed protein product [Leptidea sinapis]
MGRDGDVPTIFNPKRVRAPSVIITSEEVETDRSIDVERERPNGPPTPLSPRAPLTPQTSVSSAPPLTTQPSLQQTFSESAASSQDEERQLRGKKCPRSCCSKIAKKIYYGVCVTFILVASWVTVTHCIKYLYLQDYTPTNGADFSLFNNYTSRFLTHHLTGYNILLLIMLLTARFLSRCGLFCLLWVVTIYMFTYSLKILLSTDVVALFATNVSCVYLLSWVILHEQFVGVRVLFRKVMGEVNTGQKALFFSILGVVNLTLLWPVCLALYLTGTELVPIHSMPWLHLLIASAALLVFHLVFQFGNLVTYNIFVSFSLIVAVPVSGALDVALYGVRFEGMKLSGIVLITVGFCLVMFPDNWPDYIMRLLRFASFARSFASLF